MALQDGRIETAARLLGFADKSWRRIGTAFPDVAQERAQIHAALAASLEPAALDSLLALGGLLDEEEVCTQTRLR